MRFESPKQSVKYQADDLICTAHITGQHSTTMRYQNQEEASPQGSFVVSEFVYRAFTPRFLHAEFSDSDQLTSKHIVCYSSLQLCLMLQGEAVMKNHNVRASDV